MKHYFFLGLFFIFSACSFNKLFLQPTKLSPSTKKIRLAIESDTSYVYFDSTSFFQPVFLSKKNDTIQTSYKITSFSFKSLSGNILNGWLLQSRTVKQSATLLHLHGNAGFLLSQYQAMIPLLDLGFQAFVIDYSGFGFSEGKATRKNLLIDVNSMLSYVKTRSEIKNLPLVIYGQSLGGHLSAVVAAQREADIDALVIEGAFSSHKDIAAVGAKFLGRIFVKEQYSALKSIPKFHKPVLIIHSKEDEVIPIKLGKKLFDAANQPKVFYEITGAHIQGTDLYADSIASKIKLMIGLK
jgi:alpha-beta hydrolase superfamily lysophospholipase